MRKSVVWLSGVALSAGLLVAGCTGEGDFEDGDELKEMEQQEGADEGQAAKDSAEDMGATDAQKETASDKGATSNSSSAGTGGSAGGDMTGSEGSSAGTEKASNQANQ